MTIRSILRFKHGCIDGGNGKFYIPGLMQLSEEGLFYAAESIGYQTEYNLANINPSKMLGCTHDCDHTETEVFKVELTPNKTCIDAYICNGHSDLPTLEELCIPTMVANKCATVLDKLIAGRSCDVTLTTESNHLIVYLPSFNLDTNGNVIIDENGDPIVSLPLDNALITKYNLENNSLYELRFEYNDGVFSAPSELVQISFIDLDLIPLSPTQTNPMGICDILI